MNKHKLSVAILCGFIFFIGCSKPVSQDPVQIAVDNADRTIKFTERDKFRNPAATWVLLDYFDIIVHVFDKEERDYYSLENVWADAPKKEFNDEKI